MLIGGWGRERQKFVAEAASAQATMLLLATVALVLPAMFLLAQGGDLPPLGQEATRFPPEVEHMSFAVAIVLLLSYFAGPVVLAEDAQGRLQSGRGDEERPEGAWSVRRSVGLLALAGVAVGFMSEILVGSIEEASEGIGLSPFFVSLIIVAIVGNAAEHWVAVYFAAARQDGHLDRDRDRLERPDRAVRDAGAGPAELRDRPVPAGAGVQLDRDRRRPARGADRRPRLPGRRVDVVRGRAAARRLRRRSAIVFYFV